MDVPRLRIDNNPWLGIVSDIIGRVRVMLTVTKNPKLKQGNIEAC